MLDQGFSSDNKIKNEALITINQKDQVIEQITNEKNQLASEKDQLIQQLTNELNQLRATQKYIVNPVSPPRPLTESTTIVNQDIIQPEEVKVDVSNPRPHTRSQGPVEQGSTIETMVFDKSGRLTETSFKYKLQNGQEYNVKGFFTKLLLPDKGSEIQTFKLAFRNTNPRRSFNKAEDYTKYVDEELNRLLESKIDLIVLVMKSIIDSNPNISASFKKLYENKSRELKK